MKKGMLTAVTAFAALTLFAAGKTEQVAAGFPAWTGVVPKNHITGREITPSDLRHRFAIVVELEANEKLAAQTIKAADLAAFVQLQPAFNENWETRVFPRDLLVLYSVRGGGKDVGQLMLEAMKTPKDNKDEHVSRALQAIRTPYVAVYSDVTLEGGPDTAGKRPYVYVMGVTGTSPIYQGPLKSGATKAVSTAIAKAKKELPAGYAWAPFFGSVDPAKYPALAKAVEKGRAGKSSPLAPLEKVIMKDILAKDAAKAADAQIVYDALNQTRGDLVARIKMEAAACPHRAVYDMQELTRFWPGEKKRLDMVAAKLKSMPEANKLAQIFCKVMPLANPEFTCKSASEAKKWVAELTKMKKDLEKLKESKTVVVQNGAQLLDVQIDELIEVLPTRAPEK